MAARIESLRIGPEKNFCYLILCPLSGETALVDPAFEFVKINKWVQKIASTSAPKVKYLLATHGHWDHAGGMNDMLKLFPQALVVAHESESKRLKDLKVRLDVALKDHESIKLGEVEIVAYHTPGHTEGGCCFKVDNQLFTGDTLFIDQCGRTDLAGGSDEKLFSSLQKLKSLDPSLLVRPGHDYGPKPTATLAEQCHTNPTLNATSLSEFINLP